MVIGAYVLADVTGLVRWGRLTSYHTLGAKLAAVLMGAAVLALFRLERSGWLLYPAAVVAVVAYVEEVAITLTLPRWATDVPTWWHARRLRAEAAAARRDPV